MIILFSKIHFSEKIPNTLETANHSCGSPHLCLGPSLHSRLRLSGCLWELGRNFLTANYNWPGTGSFFFHLPYPFNGNLMFRASVSFLVTLGRLMWIIGRGEPWCPSFVRSCKVGASTAHVLLVQLGDRLASALSRWLVCHRSPFLPLSCCPDPLPNGWWHTNIISGTVDIKGHSPFSTFSMSWSLLKIYGC